MDMIPLEDDVFGEFPNFEDVYAFHDRFELPRPDKPEFASKEIMELRIKHLFEEVREVEDAYKAGNLAEYFDGLIDLVYVALGGAVITGLPWQDGWDLVHAANMAKVRALRKEDSTRGSTYDVIKPAGWIAPDIQGVLDATNK